MPASPKSPFQTQYTEKKPQKKHQMFSPIGRNKGLFSTPVPDHQFINSARPAMMKNQSTKYAKISRSLNKTRFMDQNSRTRLTAQDIFQQKNKPSETIKVEENDEPRKSPLGRVSPTQSPDNSPKDSKLDQDQALSKISSVKFLPMISRLASPVPPSQMTQIEQRVEASKSPALVKHSSQELLEEENLESMVKILSKKYVKHQSDDPHEVMHNSVSDFMMSYQQTFNLTRQMSKKPSLGVLGNVTVTKELHHQGSQKSLEQTLNNRESKLSMNRTESKMAPNPFSLTYKFKDNANITLSGPGKSTSQFGATDSKLDVYLNTQMVTPNKASQVMSSDDVRDKSRTEQPFVFGAPQLNSPPLSPTEKFQKGVEKVKAVLPFIRPKDVDEELKELLDKEKQPESPSQLRRDAAFLRPDIYDSVPVAMKESELLQAGQRLANQKKLREMKKANIMRGVGRKLKDLIAQKFVTTKKEKVDDLKDIIKIRTANAIKKLSNGDDNAETLLLFKSQKKDFENKKEQSVVDRFVEVQLAKQKKEAYRKKQTTIDINIFGNGDMTSSESEDDQDPDVIEQERERIRKLKEDFEVQNIGKDAFDKLVLGETQENFSVRHVKNRVNTHEAFKSRQGGSIYEYNRDDARFQYQVKCQTDLNIALPILDYIKGKTLVLQNYTLSQGHCNALAEACRLWDRSINRIFFDNCGIDDEEFAAILGGCVMLDDFKSIIYKQNVFDEKSLLHIIPILHKRLPDHLEELRLIDCKLKPEILEELVVEIHKRSQISKLAFIHANMSDKAFGTSLDILASSRYLQQLDLSWCEVGPNLFFQLFKLIGDNRRLTHLTLGWNTLFELGPEEAKGEMSRKTEQQLEYLMKFAKHNIYLQHLDLQYTQMNGAMIKKFCSCLRRCLSLRSVHLCGNPGLKEEGITDWIVKRIHAKPIEPAIALNQSKHKKTKRVETPMTDESLLSDEEAVYNLKRRMSSYQKGLGLTEQQRQEAQTLKMIKEGKLLNNPTGNKPIVERSKFIIERNIGHKHCAPGSGQWRILLDDSEECWLCDMAHFTIIFWSPSIGFISKQTQKDPDTVRYYRQQTSQVQRKMSHKINSMGLPEISGSFTNWKPKPMIGLFDYCHDNDKEAEVADQKILQRWKDEAKVSTYRTIKTLSAEEKKEMEKELKDYRLQYMNDWRKRVLDSCSFKKPSIQNAANLERFVGNEPVFIFFAFIRPGKQFYTVNYKPSSNQETAVNNAPMARVQRFKRMATMDNSFFLHQTIVRCRDEDIPQYNKIKRMALQERRFVKHASVFAQWKEDSAATIKNCYFHDSSYWKLNKFIKEPEDLRAVEKLILDNFAKIKDMFNYYAALSRYPCISCNDFRNFARNWGVVGENLPMTSIDIIFVATNFEEGEQEDNPQNELVRFEFIEIIVRMASQKFKYSNVVDTHVAAFKKLWDDFLEPFYNKTIKALQSFRNDVLWTLDVHDVLNANIQNLKKLFFHFSSKKGTNDNAAVLMVKEISHMLSAGQLATSMKQLQTNFSLSKQTVVNDNDEKGQLQYQRMTFVEFLEFIGRISIIKFAGTELEDLGLAEKIAYVLDDLFAVIGVTRNEVEVEQEEVSESDEDY